MYKINLTHAPPPRPSRSSVVVHDDVSHSWLRVPRGPVLIKSLSFGAAAGYVEQGGLPVLEDRTAPSAPCDLAAIGAECVHGTPVVAAFVLGRKTHLRIHAALQLSTRAARKSRFAFLRAHAHGVERVPPTLVEFNPAGGFAHVDLPLKNLPLDLAHTLREDWTWDTGLAENERSPAPEAWQPHGITPICIYITAARPRNPLLAQSFYHVACAIPGAHDAPAAEAQLWSAFARAAGNPQSPLTNARAQPLSMWRTSFPGNVQNEYVCRGGLQLVVHRDSSCLGWADLLRQAFWIHGIDAAVKLVSVDPARVGLEVPTFNIHTADGGIQRVREVGLIVKSFRWAPRGTIDPAITCGPNDIINPGDFAWKLNLANNPVGLPWPEPDLRPLRQPGLLSLDCNAYGIYCNHAVVQTRHADRETWYDPSHALGPHPDLLAYQQDLLGVGEPNPGGLFAVVGCRLRKRLNPLTRQDEILCVGEVFYGAAPAPETLCLQASDTSQ